MGKRKLIEQYRRLDHIDPESCTPIRLGNGEAWFFQRPVWEIHPIFKDGKAVDHTRILSLGELDPLVEAIAAESADPVKQVQTVLLLGALLLKRTYDLDDSELERLFSCRAGDPASEAMVTAIIEVATGKKRGGVPSTN